EKLAQPAVVEAPRCQTLDEVVADRVARLTLYQNAAYAERYRELVQRVRRADSGADQALSKAVARYYFKLLAYKDEYEVARLYSDGSFIKQLEAQFAGDYRLQFHLAPSWLSKADAVTGQPRKRQFGPWMLKAFGVLAKFKFLRGTPFDPFGYSAERQLECELIEEYEHSIEHLLKELNAGNYRTAVALAELPEQLRGYGHVKEQALAKVREQGKQLQARLLVSEIQAVQLFEPAA
ncbi:indolepyruvate ferredoxin oxidoreductase family protein, partial [Pseudomonas sp. CrR25]|nr:indolepyruvate ferredoxin oxidoreductase family protein [Pseudomonas sp. CrR25]